MLGGLGRAGGNADVQPATQALTGSSGMVEEIPAAVRVLPGTADKVVVCQVPD